MIQFGRLNNYIFMFRFVQIHNFHAISIVTCVGSLQQVNIRLASFSKINTSDDWKMGPNYLTSSSKKYEIVSLVGTLENSYNPDNEDAADQDITSYGHIHISIADEEGRVYGGHLMSGCIIYTTAEITLVEIPEFEYHRKPCQVSGYAELSVRPRRRRYHFTFCATVVDKIKRFMSTLKSFLRSIIQ